MIKRILVGLAGTPYTDTAIRRAVELAKAHEAEVTGVTVVDVQKLSMVGPVPIGAEVAAVAAKEAFDHLDAPIERVATRDVPVPFAPHLEAAIIPGEERIEEAIRAAIGA